MDKKNRYAVFIQVCDPETWFIGYEIYIQKNILPRLHCTWMLEDDSAAFEINAIAKGSCMHFQSSKILL